MVGLVPTRMRRLSGLAAHQKRRRVSIKRFSVATSSKFTAISLPTGAAVRMLYGEDGRIVGLVSLATSYFVLSNALEHTKPHADYDRLTILILPNCAECVFFSFIK